MGHSATDMESAGVCCASTWACGLYAPAATAAEAVESRAHREQLLCTSAAVPLVKQAAVASSCSVAQTGMHSPGHCPSGGRQWPVLYYAHGGTDTRGHDTQHESHSGASSAVSLWTSWRYLRRIHSAGLLCCWTQSSAHHQHIAPEVQLQYGSNTENTTDRVVRFLTVNSAWIQRIELKCMVLTERRDKFLRRVVPLLRWSKWSLQYNFPGKYQHKAAKWLLNFISNMLIQYCWELTWWYEPSSESKACAPCRSVEPQVEQRKHSLWK